MALQNECRVVIDVTSKMDQNSRPCYIRTLTSVVPRLSTTTMVGVRRKYHRWFIERGEINKTKMRFFERIYSTESVHNLMDILD